MPPKDGNIQTTEKDGFITSQQYIPTGDESNQNSSSEQNEELPKKEKKKPKQKDKNSSRETVLTFQLAVCIILAIAAYVIKSFGGEFYDNVKEMYYTNLNNSIIIDMQNDDNDDFIREAINELSSQEG